MSDDFEERLRHQLNCIAAFARREHRDPSFRAIVDSHIEKAFEIATSRNFRVNSENGGSGNDR